MVCSITLVYTNFLYDVTLLDCTSYSYDVSELFGIKINGTTHLEGDTCFQSAKYINDTLLDVTMTECVHGLEVVTVQSSDSTLVKTDTLGTIILCLQEASRERGANHGVECHYKILMLSVPVKKVHQIVN